MRIAILASDFIRIPPRIRDVPAGFSGAPEMMVYTITEELVKRGYDVTLFASGDSDTSAKLFSLQKKATGLNPNIGIGKHIDYEYALISHCFQLANKGKFDIIHSHFDVRSAILNPFSKVPVVATLHSPLIGDRKELLELYKSYQYYVSISNAQRRELPSLKYVETVYHGIDIKEIKFSDEKTKNDLVIVGRIHPLKGVDRAIEIAKKVRKKLIIIGSSDKQTTYWKNDIKPFINKDRVLYLGQLLKSKVFENLRQSKIFVFPIEWEEPFGLVMIEAMASGTPVVAYARGSVPEVVKDGVTGFIVNFSESDKRGNWIIKKTGLAGMVEAVKRIYDMPEEQYQQMRIDCRKYAEEKFTVKKMVDSYEKVYQKVIESWKKR